MSTFIWSREFFIKLINMHVWMIKGRFKNFFEWILIWQWPVFALFSIVLILTVTQRCTQSSEMMFNAYLSVRLLLKNLFFFLHDFIILNNFHFLSFFPFSHSNHTLFPSSVFFIFYLFFFFSIYCMCYLLDQPGDFSGDILWSHRSK